VKQILKLMTEITKCIKVHRHKGTYKILAWVIPGKDDVKPSAASFARQP
jgi:hypothetical protein